MSSAAQIEANRLNSQRSTGPVTDEGKANSRLNAFKHGAFAAAADITGINPEPLAAREKEYFEHFRPVGPDEMYHFNIMLAAVNEQEYCKALETLTLKHVMEQLPEDHHNPLGEAYYRDSEGPCCFEKISRRYETASRRWLRSRKIFAQLQQLRHESEYVKKQRL